MSIKNWSYKITNYGLAKYISFYFIDEWTIVHKEKAKII